MFNVLDQPSQSIDLNPNALPWHAWSCKKAHKFSQEKDENPFREIQTSDQQLGDIYLK